MDFYKQWLGIPEGPRPPDHYELLRLKRFEDDLEKIRANYKKLNAHVRKYATGQYSVQSQDLLNEIAKAMLCLTDEYRKRDYDESLGREFPAELNDFGRQPMLDIMCREGTISREQRKEAEEFADRRGLTVRDAVVQMKLVDAPTATRALAKEIGVSYVDLEDMLPEDDILDLVPRMLVKQHSFIPLFIDDGQLLIACVDQPEHELEEELRMRYDVPVRPVLSAPRSINQAIAQFYPPGLRDEAKVKKAAPPPAVGKKAKAGGKSAAKAGKTETAVKEKPKSGAARVAASKASFKDLSPEEQAQRKQWGILYMCWSVVVPMAPQLIASYNPVWASQLPIGFTTNLLLTIPIAAGTIYWVTQKYWK